MHGVRSAAEAFYVKNIIQLKKCADSVSKTSEELRNSKAEYRCFDDIQTMRLFEERERAGVVGRR